MINNRLLDNSCPQSNDSVHQREIHFWILTQNREFISVNGRSVPSNLVFGLSECAHKFVVYREWDQHIRDYSMNACSSRFCHHRYSDRTLRLDYPSVSVCLSFSICFICETTAYVIYRKGDSINTGLPCGEVDWWRKDSNWPLHDLIHLTITGRVLMQS